MSKTAEEADPGGEGEEAAQAIPAQRRRDAQRWKPAKRTEVWRSVIVLGDKGEATQETGGSAEQAPAPLVASWRQASIRNTHDF